MIIIKDTDVLKEVLCGFEPVLVEIATYIVYLYGNAVFTSGYREGDPGVHGQKPGRGLDLRSWIYSNPQEVADVVNSKWQYDPRRPKKKCAIVHKTKTGAVHLHLQSHPKTVRIL